MFATERRDLQQFEWSTNIKPYPERIVPTADWRTVKAVFLDQFETLMASTHYHGLKDATIQ